MTQIIQIQEIEKILNKNEIMLFAKLQNIIRKINEITNLTRLIEGDDYWISQVYDSVWPFFKNTEKLFDGKKFIDIGSGCGFPGLAYSITHPNSEVYLIDSSRKKTEALKKIIDELDINNKIYIINDRIENVAHNSKYRNKFDIGTTRAVSSPSTVAEYILPMLNKGGSGLLYCGKWTTDHEDKIKNSLQVLKGSITEIRKTFLPKDKGERNIIYIQAKYTCPNSYPRAIGKAEKNPL